MRLDLLRRSLAITGAVALGGAGTGALSAAAAVTIAMLVLGGGLPPLELVGAAIAVGAGFGALIAPSLAWLLLRAAPIGLAIVTVAAGAGVGGALGLLAGFPSMNPYGPEGLLVSPVREALLGAMLGATLSAAGVRVLARQRRLRENAS